MPGTVLDILHQPVWRLPHRCEPADSADGCAFRDFEEQAKQHIRSWTTI